MACKKVVDETAVCGAESKAWVKCVDNTYHRGGPKSPNPLETQCVAERAAFETCAAQWRAEVGPSVRLRGENPGEPPPQCAPMACVIANCLEAPHRDYERCTGAVRHLNRCVLLLYGKEYVDET